MTGWEGIPRIDLHCHLDASMRIATIEELAAEAGLSYDRPVAELATVPAEARSLPELLSALDVQIDVLQSTAAIERAAFELGEDFAADRVVHGEVRFAPHLHQRNGESLDDIIVAAATGLRRAGSIHGLSTALLLCALRHRNPDEGVELVEAARRHQELVRGLDLAGPEAGFPATPFREAFRAAADAGLGITIHAGEAAGPDSVRQALELGATRIGHGVRSIQDPELVKTLARDGITLECAPRCNVVTGAVESLDTHPIDRLHGAGVPTTVNTDTRTALATTIEHELDALASGLGWDRTRALRAQRDAALAAFVTESRRRELLAMIDDASVTATPEG